MFFFTIKGFSIIAHPSDALRLDSNWPYIMFMARALVTLKKMLLEKNVSEKFQVFLTSIFICPMCRHGCNVVTAVHRLKKKFFLKLSLRNYSI